jgi:cytochrome c oxidase subunit 3
MTERADVLHPMPDEESMRAPRVPVFDSADLPPDSGVTDSHGSEPRFRLDADGMGACLFVAADGVVFAGLFGLYAALHGAHPEIFAHGRYFLNPITGAAANSVLLLGCLTSAFAVRFARKGNTRNLEWSLAATIVLAGFFLGIQSAEYSDKVERRLLPGRYFMATEQVWQTHEFRREHARAAQYAEWFRPGDPSRTDERGAARAAVEPLVAAGALGERAVFPNLPSEPRNAHVFFGLYFLFSGVFAIHVLGGAAVWAWLLSRVRRNSSESTYFTSVEYASLYWNFITVVRVLMFPLFYLVR